MRKHTIAVDFDGTIVQHRYPEIGEPVPWALETLIQLRKKGIPVFLWTMRGHPKAQERDTLQEAINFCKVAGLEFDGINYSPVQFSTSSKQYASIYIDDAAIGCPIRNDGSVDWTKVIKELIIKGILVLDDCLEIFGTDKMNDVFDHLSIYHGHTYPKPNEQ